MQKNLSQSAKYIRRCRWNVLRNLRVGTIIFAATITSLLGGCEPVLLSEPNIKKESLPSATDSVHETGPEINEWDTDTTVYHSEAKPAKRKHH